MKTKAWMGQLKRRLLNQPLSVRLHCWMRLKSFPFNHVVRFIPNKGLLVDFGCGFGLFSWLLSYQRPQQDVVAYDVDARKLAVAKQILSRLTNVMVVGSRRKLIPLKPTTIIMLDVLYLLPEKQKQRLLKQQFNWLKRGGKLVISIVPREKSWQYALAWLQEWVMVNLWQKTSGQTIDFETLVWIKTTLHTLGFEHIHTSVLTTPWPFFHRHLVVVANKPA